jgi:hypothetical protein
MLAPSVVFGSDFLNEYWWPDRLLDTNPVLENTRRNNQIDKISWVVATYLYSFNIIQHVNYTPNSVK